MPSFSIGLSVIKRESLDNFVSLSMLDKVFTKVFKQCKFRWAKEGNGYRMYFKSGTETYYHLETLKMN